MQKVLNAYENNPTDANAQKVRTYNLKHPMASCFLRPEELAVLQQAVQQAGG